MIKKVLKATIALLAVVFFVLGVLTLYKKLPVPGALGWDELPANHKTKIALAIRELPNAEDLAEDFVLLSRKSTSSSVVYKFAYGERLYVVRILNTKRSAKSAYDEFVASYVAAAKGIAPHIYYSDLGTKTLLMAYVSNASRPIKETPFFAEVGKMLRHLHAGPAFPNNRSVFDHFQLIKRSLKDLYPKYHKDLVKLIDYSLALEPLVHDRGSAVPSHRNLSPGNVLVSNKKIAMIDWFQAGQDSALLDLNTLAIFYAADSSQEKMILDNYFEEPLTERQQAAYRLMKIVALTWHGIHSLSKYPAPKMNLAELSTDIDALKEAIIADEHDAVSSRQLGPKLLALAFALKEQSEVRQSLEFLKNNQ